MGYGPAPAALDDVWELYDTNADWSQVRDLAAEMPDKLAELQDLFLEEARRYGVLPLDDRRVERFNPDLAGRPTLIKGTTQLLFGGMGRLTENVLVNVKNKSHSVTSEIIVPDGGATGVDHGAGWRLRRLVPVRARGNSAYCYNLFGLQRFKVYGGAVIPEGTHQVRMEFTYDGGGLAKGGAVTLFIDGDRGRQGTGRSDRADGFLG